MAELIVIVYPEEERAGQVLTKLKELSSEYLIDLDDAVYVVKDMKSKVKMHHSHNVTGAGIVFGAFWGLLIGLLLFIPIGGLVIGAIAGAIGSRLTDYGIDERFAKTLSNEMTPGSSAIFMLARKVTPVKVEPELAKFGGKILRTSLSKDAEAKLQAVLNGPVLTKSSQ